MKHKLWTTILLLAVLLVSVQGVTAAQPSAGINAGLNAPLNEHVPGAFSKLSPVDWSIEQPTTVTLNWVSSPGATSYEYCLEAVPNCIGRYKKIGNVTSVVISGLHFNKAYYWQVRAKNSVGKTKANGGVWWSFSTTGGNPPGSFNKTAPVNGAVNQWSNTTLSWNGSFGANSYEFCYDTTNNDVCDGIWLNIGLALYRDLSGLAFNTTYYWQVRAVNGSGTAYANNFQWWSFTTGAAQPPGAFGKISPANGATGQSVDLTLTWAASSNVDTYAYCYDKTNNNLCDNNIWYNVGNVTNAELSGLALNTTYYWQVRAIGALGTTYADGGAWWSFTTYPVLGFVKISPTDGALGQTTTLTLTWNFHTSATSYEYCLDKVKNSSCDTSWKSVGTALNVTVTGLKRDTTYYWQVRARTPSGKVLANNGTWWNFKTIP